MVVFAGQVVGAAGSKAWMTRACIGRWECIHVSDSYMRLPSLK